MKRCTLLLATLAALAGCGPLLGGRCSEGWSVSPGACDAGAGRDAADLGATTDLPDGAPGADGAHGDGALTDTDAALTEADAAHADGALADAALTDGASGSCTPPQTLCGSACVDTASSASHCGECGRACGTGVFCASGACSATCGAPLLLCAGVCVDPQTDAQNCGGCGVVCSTGICNAGRCRDARAGHLVLIGHDYETTRPDQDRVVGNAVFLSASSAPRVATCAVGARASSVTNVRGAVRGVAGLREWREVVVAAPEDLPAVFSVDTTDVVLIHHQPAATAAAIDALALRITGPAVGFLRAGGVVVVLDGEGASRGTWPLAAATGLLAVTGHSPVTGGAAEVVSGADALAIGLPVAYRAERGSVGFLGTDGSGVVIRAGGLPLVLHRVVFGR